MHVSSITSLVTYISVTMNKCQQSNLSSTDLALNGSKESITTIIEFFLQNVIHVKLKCSHKDKNFAGFRHRGVDVLQCD